MPLYVLCIGAITNVARALQQQPEIAKHMTIVWIGGNALDCREPSWELAKNLSIWKDRKAAL